MRDPFRYSAFMIYTAFMMRDSFRYSAFIMIPRRDPFHYTAFNECSVTDLITPGLPRMVDLHCAFIVYMHIVEQMPRNPRINSENN